MRRKQTADPSTNTVEHEMSRNKQVVVGGGFAGTTLVGELERRLPPEYKIVLVSEESYTTFNPMLAEVVGASVFPEHVVAPIRQMLDASRGTRFIMGRVVAVDHESVASARAESRPPTR